MGKALYRKYRSKKLDEIIGQEHITDTLKQALKSGRISHAYLFTGPRGVGKTSIARILAHEINNLPYEDEEQNHIDITEIDAASNRRIDEIRELRDKVYVAPTSAKYKVYIIDEVHMLTREAFNALLKTLEEPPAHSVFILATTDAHKLPETIISRTQRFTFRPVERAKVVSHLKDIAKQEKIDFDDEALELLAEHGEGNFRDSISLLDQASSKGEHLTVAAVEELLGLPPKVALEQLTQEIQSGNLSAIMQTLTGLYEQGYQATSIAKELAVNLRQLLTANQDANPEILLKLLGDLLEVPVSANPERYLEIVVLRALPHQRTAAPTQHVEAPKQQPVIDDRPKKADKPDSAPEKPLKVEEADRSDIEIAPASTLDAVIWPQILTALKQKYNTLYGVVRMAQPDFSKNGKLTLEFGFAFHQKRINDAKNRQLISETIKQITGQSVSIECVLNKEAKPFKASDAAQSEPQAPVSSDISTISNIFGGAELLES